MCNLYRTNGWLIDKRIIVKKVSCHFFKTCLPNPHWTFQVWLLKGFPFPKTVSFHLKLCFSFSEGHIRVPKCLEYIILVRMSLLTAVASKPSHFENQVSLGPRLNHVSFYYTEVRASLIKPEFLHVATAGVGFIQACCFISDAKFQIPSTRWQTNMLSLPRSWYSIVWDRFDVSTELTVPQQSLVLLLPIRISKVLFFAPDGTVRPWRARRQAFEWFNNDRPKFISNWVSYRILEWCH